MRANLFILFLSACLFFCNSAYTATVLPDNLKEMPVEDSDYDETQSFHQMKYEMKYGKKNLSESDKDQDTEENKNETENEETDAENEGFSLKSSSSEKPISYRCAQDEVGRTFCAYTDGKPLNGKIAEKNDAGQYSKIENYKKGFLDGLCTYYNERGVLKERTYYKSGLKNGMSKLYYSYNNVQIAANYKNGLLDGMLDIYTTQGKLLGRLRYKKGVLEKGTCYTNGKKENIKNDTIKNHEFNTIYSCGTSL